MATGCSCERGANPASGRFESPGQLAAVRRNTIGLRPVADTVCIYRAPMRARDLDLPAGAGADYGLAAGIVGIGPGVGEKAARMLHRFATVPAGSFVWTRASAGSYHLGQISGDLREDRSPAAVSVGLVHVRATTWLARAFDETEVPRAVADTFARGGRNFQRTHDGEAERMTAEIWWRYDRRRRRV